MKLEDIVNIGEYYFSMLKLSKEEGDLVFNFEMFVDNIIGDKKEITQKEQDAILDIPLVKKVIIPYIVENVKINPVNINFSPTEFVFASPLLEIVSEGKDFTFINSCITIYPTIYIAFDNVKDNVLYAQACLKEERVKGDKIFLKTIFSVIKDGVKLLIKEEASKQESFLPKSYQTKFGLCVASIEYLTKALNALEKVYSSIKEKDLGELHKLKEKISYQRHDITKEKKVKDLKSEYNRKLVRSLEGLLELFYHIV